MTEQERGIAPYAAGSFAPEDRRPQQLPMSHQLFLRVKRPPSVSFLPIESSVFINQFLGGEMTKDRLPFSIRQAALRKIDKLMFQ